MSEGKRKIYILHHHHQSSSTWGQMCFRYIYYLSSPLLLMCHRPLISSLFHNWVNSTQLAVCKIKFMMSACKTSRKTVVFSTEASYNLQLCSTMLNWMLCCWYSLWCFAPSNIKLLEHKVILLRLAVVSETHTVGQKECPSTTKVHREREVFSTIFSI